MSHDLRAPLRHISRVRVAAAAVARGSSARPPKAYVRKPLSTRRPGWDSSSTTAGFSRIGRTALDAPASRARILGRRRPARDHGDRPRRPRDQPGRCIRCRRSTPTRRCCGSCSSTPVERGQVHAPPRRGRHRDRRRDRRQARDGRSTCATTASASTCSTRTSCSACSSACTAPTSSRHRHRPRQRAADRPSPRRPDWAEGAIDAGRDVLLLAAATTRTSRMMTDAPTHSARRRQRERRRADAGALRDNQRRQRSRRVPRRRRGPRLSVSARRATPTGSPTTPRSCCST